MSMSYIISELIACILTMTLQNESVLPSTFGLRYDLVSNLVSWSSIDRYWYVDSIRDVLKHPAVQQDLSLTKTMLRTLKPDQCNDSESIVDMLYALLQSFK